MDYIEYIEANTIRCEASGRGGGIEIGLDDLLGTEGYKMSAYQNYLGGGMLGSIQGSANFEPSKLNKKQQKQVAEVADALKRYFHNLTNHEGDEWEEAEFEENQARPASAY
jgi:hypothetical protein